MTDDPGDDVLEARPLRIGRWPLVAIAVVVVALGGVQVARHVGRHHTAVSAPARPSPTPTPQARVIEGQALLSNVVGSRCPTSVVCGVGATVSAGMAAGFRADFPDATISLQASAFDAGQPRTYWQQISATAASGVLIVLTEQRLLVPRARSGAVVVNRSADGEAASVSKTRGAWRIIVNLTGSGVQALPVTAARHWVTVTPLPR